MTNTPFYITTAIAYPNGRPHIGHAYEAIATDAIARFHRMSGKDVRLVTGTDEHGLKMVQTARGAGKDVGAFADEMSSHFRSMCDELNISYDVFMRTTDPRHHEASIALWRAMEASGDLYLDRYEGWYSVRDEAFYDESELSAPVNGEGAAQERLSPQGTPVEWTAEETWFFRLSKYQEPLLKLFAEQPEFVQPDSRRNEVLRFIEGGLRDLSVSRTSFDWGVPVPGSPGHVMYVWVDALTTYLSGIGYPNGDGDGDGDFAKFWPADLHIIGKDIVRFHAVYWPAMLMSAGLPLPKQIFGHGFLLARGGEKMSKSAGNVVDPLTLAESFGVDQLRYFLLRDVSFGQDGTYSAEAIVTRCNAELANSFGNLAQRTLAFIAKNLGGVLPVMNEHEAADTGLLEFVSRKIGVDMPHAFSALALSQGIEHWMEAVFACNAYIDVQAPWALRKTNPERMETVLATLYVCIAQLAVAIQPVTPNAAQKLLDLMGLDQHLRTYADVRGHWYSPLAASGFILSQPTPIFPRLELPVENENV